MIHKNILMIGAALLMSAPILAVTPDDNNDGTTQTLTVNEKKVERIVSEIRLDGNNAVLLFTDGTTLTADMRLVTLTMSYDDATEVRPTPKPLPEMEGSSYYTLDGRKLTVKPKQKGVYIQKGKKVVNNK